MARAQDKIKKTTTLDRFRTKGGLGSAKGATYKTDLRLCSENQGRIERTASKARMNGQAIGGGIGTLLNRTEKVLGVSLAVENQDEEPGQRDKNKKQRWE